MLKVHGMTGFSLMVPIPSVWNPYSVVMKKYVNTFFRDTPRMAPSSNG